MGLIAKKTGSDLWQNLKNCPMSAIIQYVKGTMIRKMSCYCGYILGVTTILKNNELLLQQSFIVKLFN